jgi:hypothetical protein
MADQQRAIVVHDKTCIHKQSLTGCHFMSKLFSVSALKTYIAESLKFWEHKIKINNTL